MIFAFTYNEPQAFFIVIHSLFQHSSNRFLHSLLFRLCFPFPFIYLLLQVLSYWSVRTLTNARWFLSLCCLIPPLLKQSGIPFRFLWRSFKSVLWQRKFQPRNVLWSVWKSSSRGGSLDWKSCSSRKWKPLAQYAHNWSYLLGCQSTSSHLYACAEGRSDSTALFHVRNWKNFPATFLKSSWFLQLHPDNSQEKAQILYQMSLSTAFEAQLYPHVVASMSRKVIKKKLSIVQNVLNSTLVGMTAQLLQKASDALKRSCSLGRLLVVIQR